jgi:hypothetical protein
MQDEEMKIDHTHEIRQSPELKNAAAQVKDFCYNMPDSYSLIDLSSQNVLYGTQPAKTEM